MPTSPEKADLSAAYRFKVRVAEYKVRYTGRNNMVSCENKCRKRALDTSGNENGNRKRKLKDIKKIFRKLKYFNNYCLKYSSVNGYLRYNNNYKTGYCLFLIRELGKVFALIVNSK